MQPFVQYSLAASIFWGVMSVLESMAGQHRMHSALLTKFILYGLSGAVLLLLLKGPHFLYDDLCRFTQEKPWLLAVFGLVVSFGSLGVYFMYCAFDQCGNNKALAIIISYCVPSVIVAILSYSVLKESYNWLACVGAVMILFGVLLIDIYGVNHNSKSNAGE